MADDVPAGLATPRHWHAYAYTGRAFTDGQVRKRQAGATFPPYLLRHWLTRPAAHVAETFRGPEAAVKWVRSAIEEHEPLDAAAFPVWQREQYARRTLGQAAGADVVLGYYSTSRTFVSRALIACPRLMDPAGGPAPRCPEGGR